MTFTQVRQYAVGLIKASTNKAVLDALADDNGTLTYNGQEIGSSSEESISTQDIESAIAEDVNDINGVEEQQENNNSEQTEQTEQTEQEQNP